jgi:hypothetical protein
MKRGVPAPQSVTAKPPAGRFCRRGHTAHRGPDGIRFLSFAASFFADEARGLGARFARTAPGSRLATTAPFGCGPSAFTVSTPSRGSPCRCPVSHPFFPLSRVVGGHLGARTRSCPHRKGARVLRRRMRAGVEVRAMREGLLDLSIVERPTRWSAPTQPRRALDPSLHSPGAFGLRTGLVGHRAQMNVTGRTSCPAMRSRR